MAWTFVCATALAGCSSHTTTPVSGPGALGAGAVSTAPASAASTDDAAPTSAAAKPTSGTTTHKSSSTSSTSSSSTSRTSTSRTSSSTTRRTTTAPRTTTTTPGKGGGGGGGVSTSASGVVWPTGLPFPAGTVLAHNDDPANWSATLLAPGFQPDVRSKIIGQYEAAGFTLSAGLPDILSKAPYTLRLQVSPRDHRENESYVTLQLSRS